MMNCNELEVIMKNEQTYSTYLETKLKLIIFHRSRFNQNILTLFCKRCWLERSILIYTNIWKFSTFHFPVEACFLVGNMARHKFVYIHPAAKVNQGREPINSMQTHWQIRNLSASSKISWPRNVTIHTQNILTKKYNNLFIKNKCSEYFVQELRNLSSSLTTSPLLTQTIIFCNLSLSCMHSFSLKSRNLS